MMNKVYRLRKGCFSNAHIKMFIINEDDTTFILDNGCVVEGATWQAGEFLLKSGKYEECSFDAEKYILARKLMK
jgi:hypothetical protein